MGSDTTVGDGYVVTSAQREDSKSVGAEERAQRIQVPP
jgi:hypothetical protein